MQSNYVAHEFAKRSPWVTRFVIEGQQYGGSFDAMNDGRLAQFFDAFPRARTILELGALEGGHSFGLASNPKVDRIVALEGRTVNVEKARFVKSMLGADKVEFIQENLEDANLTSFGTFDAVFCVGLLYHLPEPWKLIAQCERISAGIFIWTHYAHDRGTDIVNGFKGQWYQEKGLRDPLSGLSQRSFWPTLASLKDMLAQNGFKNVQLIENDVGHPHGPAVTLSAIS